MLSVDIHLTSNPKLPFTKELSRVPCKDEIIKFDDDQGYFKVTEIIHIANPSNCNDSVAKVYVIPTCAA